MLSIKVKDVIPLSDMKLLVFFENDMIKLFDVKPILKNYPEFEALQNEDLFNLVKVEPGGYGISWSPELDCSEGELWEDGVELPVTPEFFINFVKYGIINTKDACDLLDCSRQNIDDLLKRKKIAPVKSFQRNKLFLKSDILKRHDVL